MSNKNISIKELAKMAGVSVATVSRVINQNGRFSDDTEARIRKIMEEYHYVPNLLARGLRTQQVSEVGIIVPDITNEFFCNLVLKIQTELFMRGYIIIICNTNEDSEVERRYLTMLRSKQVRGLVRISREYSAEDDRLHIPTVYLDRIPQFKQHKEDYITIESDHEQGGYIATTELIKKGCKRIGIVIYGAEVATTAHEKRYIGYQRALKENGIPLDSDLVQWVKLSDIASGYNAIETWLKKDIQIDGLFCTADNLAAGALKALDDYKINVPERVKIVGYDAISISEVARIPISTISQPISEMADMTVKALMSMMEGDKEDSKMERKSLILPVTLIRRKTT